MLSLRCLSIALSLACVVIGSFVAAFLAIQSGDNALSVTKDTGREAVDQCFSTASESVMLQTNSLIDSLLDQALQFMDGYLQLPMDLTTMLRDRFDFTDTDMAWDWNYLSTVVANDLWTIQHQYLGQITGIGINTAKGQLMWVHEAVATGYVPPGYHHKISGTQANGSDGCVPPGSCSFSMALTYGGRHSNNTQRWKDVTCYEPGKPWNVTVAEHRAAGKPILTDPTAHCFYDPENPGDALCGDSPDDPFVLRPRGCWCIPKCDPSRRGLPDYDNDGCKIPITGPTCKSLGFGPWKGGPFDFWLLGAALTPKGSVYWSPPLVISPYLGLVASGAWGTKEATQPPYSAYTAAWGGRAGTAWCGIDLRTVSVFLRRLVLPGLSRLFLSVAKDTTGSTIGQKNGGLLIAASRGDVSQGVAGERQDFIWPVNSSDAVIRAAANYVRERSNSTPSDLAGLQGYLILYNQTATAPVEFTAELPSEYLDGRPEEPQRLFLKVGRYIDPADRLGLWMVMTFDRYLILGPIDEKEKVTKADIAAANAKVDEDLEADRLVLYLVVAGVAVGMILLSVVFVIAIVRPLHMLGSEMDEVADMHLDHVTETLSALSEVARCQKAFLAMVRALRKYRDYMPLSLLQDGGDEEEEEEEEERKNSGAETQCSSAKPANSQLSASDKDTRKHSASRGSRASMSQATDHRKKRNAADKTQKGIAKKQVAVVAIGVSHWHDTLRAGDGEVMATHTEFLRIIVETVSSSKAVPDTFCGDRICITFNAVRPAAGYRAGAGALAAQIRTKLEAPGWWQVAGKSPSVSVATVSGEVRCGNVGCPGMMRFTLFGKVVSWGWALQRFTQSLPSQAVCELHIDSWLAAELTQSFETQMVALVQYEKRAPDPITISRVHAARKVSEDEWMYQLEEGAKADPWRLWNEAFELARTGSRDDAKQGIEQALEANESLRSNPISECFRAQLEQGTIVTILQFH